MSPVPFDGVASVSLRQEGPEFLVENHRISLPVLPSFDILIDVLSLLAFDLACSVQILVLLVLLAQVSAICHRTWMHSGKMILLISELSFRNSSVELIVEQELMVRPQPPGTDEIRRRAHLLIGSQLVLFPQFPVDFELFVEFR